MKFWKEVEKNIKIYLMSNFNFKPCHLLFGIEFNSKKKRDVDIIINSMHVLLFTKALFEKNLKRKEQNRDFILN